MRYRVTTLDSPYERYSCAECEKVWEHRTEPVNPHDDETPVYYDPEWVEVD
jgi:hypothetical protein